MFNIYIVSVPNISIRVGFKSEVNIECRLHECLCTWQFRVESKNICPYLDIHAAYYMIVFRNCTWILGEIEGKKF